MRDSSSQRLLIRSFSLVMLSLDNIINVTDFDKHVILLLELDCLELNLHHNQVLVLQLRGRSVLARAYVLRLWLHQIRL